MEFAHYCRLAKAAGTSRVDNHTLCADEGLSGMSGGTLEGALRIPAHAGLVKIKDSGLVTQATAECFDTIGSISGKTRVLEVLFANVQEHR
jgi:hypothetical protein